MSIATNRSPYPLVPLGEILAKSEEWIDILPDQRYRQVTIRMWGQGVVQRNEVAGGEMAASRRLRVRAGQFILSRIDARNGALGIVPPELDGAVVSNDFPAFDVVADRMLPEYLGWMSRTHGFVELCKAASEGTTNRVRLQEDRFLALTIPLPPLAEQRRVVARVEEIAAKVAEARRLRERAVEEMRVLMDTVRKKIFEQASKLKTARFDSVAALERGRFSHRPRNDPRFFGGQHPWIQIGEIEASKKYIREWSQTLNDDGLAISKKFPRGTLLISIAATIGSVGILDFDCCIPDSIVAVTPRPDSDSEFLYHYLCYLRSHLEQIAPQSAQKNINLEILSPLPIPKLSLIEQRRIVHELDGLQARVDLLKELQDITKAELNALLPAILHQAFQGEL